MLPSDLFRTPEGFVGEEPLCPNCGRGMWLYSVQPIASGREQRIFSCSECAQQKTLLVKHE